MFLFETVNEGEKCSVKRSSQFCLLMKDMKQKKVLFVFQKIIDGINELFGPNARGQCRSSQPLPIHM